jgi:26S proteasome regulatory subunit N9
LVKVCVTISKTFKDNSGALEFLQGLAEKVKHDAQALILLVSVIAGIKLEKRLLEQAKETIETAKTEVDKTAGVESDVYAAYYKVWADYYKAQNQPLEFYTNALKYLAYVQLETAVPINQQIELAFDLGIAALIGESIYNFGELLGHDIIKSLSGTPVEWLVNLLRVFNSGDITGYEALVRKYSQELSQQPALTANQNLLTQKISVLALMELAFKRPSDQRTISFQDVATASKLPLGEVEHLIMKALSLKLVRGTIDELDKTVTITWVQPRVLDIEQIKGMKDRLQEWTQKVQTTLLFMEGEVAPEIFA